MTSSDNNAELFTGLGAAIAIFLASAGSGIASAPAGVFAIRGRSSLKEYGPIVIAGVLAIYGFIIASILVTKLSDSSSELTAKDGYKNLSAGLVVGLSCLASGFGMAKFLEHALSTSHMTSSSHQTNTEATTPFIADTLRNVSLKTEFTLRFFFVMVFLEAIGLYGLLVALFLVH